MTSQSSIDRYADMIVKGNKANAKLYDDLEKKGLPEGLKFEKAHTGRNYFNLRVSSSKLLKSGVSIVCLRCIPEQQTRTKDIVEIYVFRYHPMMSSDAGTTQMVCDTDKIWEYLNKLLHYEVAKD